MKVAFICDAVRTAVGRYGGVLSSVRADDLAAIPLRALMERHPHVDWAALDDVYFGCANQAGEDNRNVARMAVLLAGLPESVPATTVNRLCGSSLDAVAMAPPATRRWCWARRKVRSRARRGSKTRPWAGASSIP